jgi:hypothetical protein
MTPLPIQVLVWGLDPLALAVIATALSIAAIIVAVRSRAER